MSKTLPAIDEIILFYKNASTRELTARADGVCRETYGDEVYLRGLVEFSNYCGRDCLYCGIRHSNPAVKRYRMAPEEILESVRAGHKMGLKTFVLQSGEDEFFTTKVLSGIVEKIKEIAGGDSALTLSCGIRPKKDYAELKKSGADRYLIRFETSDPELHSYLRNGVSLKRRITALRDLRDCGFEVGSGFMVELPGESEEIRINNALLCRELELDMIGVGPFIPHPETPLKDSPQMPFELALRSVALVRLLLPFSNIPATTAAGSLDPEGREKMLAAGANVLMPNITPVEFKKNYLLYPNKICLDEDGTHCIGCMKIRVGAVDKTVVNETGFSKSFLMRSNRLR